MSTINGREIHVDDEGFLTIYGWNEDLGKALAAQIGIDMTDAHWKVVRFLRAASGHAREPGREWPRHPSR